ncbi:hypothetical protein K432DRAFT_403975 [Lepidopterella palustris CBS 459.81]|uniref:F-box domain-containing protein n=1 Tax=Lepidopterella palustris CBS 459.81 TaxID=1314670 RepID=A0A8E2EC27_9PEZI|nr:hypothetical protein K432DRAFT_403975 [Lepidopterella palustris CBS 459.81]
MSLPSAVYRLCATFEVLEQILLYLSMEDVVRVQAVCVRWKFVIESSPRIQRLLFISPKVGGPFRLVAYHNYQLDGATGVIQGGPIHYEFLSPKGRITQAPLSRLADCFPNPQLNRILSGFHRDQVLSAAITEKAIHEAATKPPQNRPSSVMLTRYAFPRRLHNEWFAQQNHSWRSMYLTQPPCTAIELCTSVDVRSENSLHVHTIWNKNGVTIGQLIGALRGRERHFPEYPCVLDLFIPVEKAVKESDHDTNGQVYESCRFPTLRPG